MTVFRIGVLRESGAVMLWMGTPCGLSPIMGWADLEGTKESAEMLLDSYDSRKEEKGRIEEVSGSLLRQALGHAESFGEQED